MKPQTPKPELSPEVVTHLQSTLLWCMDHRPASSCSSIDKQAWDELSGILHKRATEPAAAGETGPWGWALQFGETSYGITNEKITADRFEKSGVKITPLYLRPPAVQPFPAGGVGEERAQFDRWMGAAPALTEMMKGFMWDAWIARSQQSQVGGWLPIESAPKNADAIDLWCFTEKQDGEDRRETRLADCYWSAGEGWSCFDSTSGAIPIQLLDWTPTHWRYAPGPPDVRSRLSRGEGRDAIPSAKDLFWLEGAVRELGAHALADRINGWSKGIPTDAALASDAERVEEK